MPDYDSPFFITNDRDDIDQARIEDGTAVVWPLSDDAKLRRSPERQYCGNYVTYGDNGAATYRHNDDTHDLIAAGPNQHRDMASNFPLVKTLTKAQARGDRQLLDVQDQDVRITTRLVDIPAERVTLAKAGMRLQIKGTHWGPTCDDWHYARIVTAQPMPHSDGSLYDIELELVMGMPVETSLSPGPPEPDYGGMVFAGLQRSEAYPGANDPLYFAATYDDPISGWFGRDVTGPIEIIESADPFATIRALSPMVVRIHAAVGFATVVSPGVDVSASVLVNGAPVASDSVSVPNLTFFGHTFVFDLRDYHLDAGDTVSVSAAGVPGAGGWGDVGTNVTWLHVCRGTVTDEDDIGEVICEGP